MTSKSAPRRKALILCPKIDECQHLASLLKQRDFDIHQESEMDKALNSLEMGGYDLVLCDTKIGEKELFLQKAQKCSPLSLLLLLDLLANSFPPSLEEACEKLKKPGHQIIAASPKMKALLADALKIANSHANLFISGESGTGKEVMAKFIHDHSPRKNESFIKVNCAALPETLIESEFFGHEKGAFTGAVSRRLGRFELADQGTLLLDEISEIPLTLQSKLLRAVQEGEFERLGGMKPIHVNVRLISTSNRHMEEAIEKNLFREDLYYRLNVVPLHIPPLRERKEEIIPLAELFLTKACQKNGKAPKRLSDEAKESLFSYNWPGNIRELANLIEHVVVLDKSDLIEAGHLPIKKREGSPKAPLGLTLRELEKWYIEETLKVYHGNKTQAAKALGIHIRTLKNKLS